jgi:benzoyl-CoA reductase/2-hydroxyglutaryl-CoA dehydratase subunit BcrC/BadD/HgdB
MLMSREEGNSFNRIVGYENCRLPERVDFDRVRNIFHKMANSGQDVLAYHNGMKVTDETLKKVSDKL